MTTKSHYLFLLPSNPWSLLASSASFNIMFSLLILLKAGLASNMFLGLLSLTFLSFLWWLKYSDETSVEGMFSLFLDNSLKVAMILFISSEVFFFFSFFWSYFHYLLSPAFESSMSWPPNEIISFDFSNVPLVNTLVLLSSGVTVTISHFYMIEKKLSPSALMLGLTVFLGILFTYMQALEYKSSFFSVSDGSFGTSFFLLTGFHGIHVIIGTIFLGTCLKRSTQMVTPAMSFTSFEMASWYWHFVDVVWIFLYFFLYYLNS